jgi:hypothetical protein
MAKKKRPEVWAPQFGCWSETSSVDPHPACELLGLFLSDASAMQTVRMCHALYFSGDQAVDPDEERHDSIRWFVRGADGERQEVSPPFAWAEARWVVPLAGAWDKAHGLTKGR